MQTQHVTSKGLSIPSTVLGNALAAVSVSLAHLMSLGSINPNSKFEQDPHRGSLSQLWQYSTATTGSPARFCSMADPQQAQLRFREVPPLGEPSGGLAPHPDAPLL